MASASSSKDWPSIADNVVPLKANLDSDKDPHDGTSVERNWELERDLALHKPAVYELDEKKAAEEAARHMSSGRNKERIKNDSLLSVLCAYVVEHQIGLSINLILLLALTHTLFPRARPFTRKFYELSYYDASTGKYTQGWDDMWLVLFWVVAFTGLRAGVMDYILKPLAHAGGIKKGKVRVRFAEQAWLVVYDSASWTLGMYLLYHTPYFFNLREIWTHWPTKQMDGLLKWYYLVQFAFWLQQIVVVNIEERRKDYVQMFTHHIFTCALIFPSYGVYLVKAGHVILCLMDFVDIILSTAKCLKYLHYNTACDIGFGIFLISWFINRHVFYLMVCWSFFADVSEIIGYRCSKASSGEFVSDVSTYPGGNNVISNVLNGWSNTNDVVCFNAPIRWGLMALLLGLQGIMLVWFTMIVRVAWGVIVGNGADDSRSDEEGEEGEEDSEIEDIDVNSKPQLSTSTASVSTYSTQRPPSAGSNGSHSTPYEEEVGVEEMYHLETRRSSTPRMKRKKSGAKGRTSALSIPGHSDPKDILNRIGCETKTTDPEER